jgi:hypothetical protein
MDASRGEREMLAAMTEMLLFIQEDPRTGRGFFLCRRDIGDSTVVSPFFLFSFFFLGVVVRPSQSSQTQLNLAGRDVRWKSNRRLLLGQSTLE